MADRTSVRNSVDRGSVRTSVTRVSKSEQERSGNNVLTMLTFVTAAGAVAVMFLAWKAKKDDFYDFMVYVLQVMNELPYIQNLVYGAWLSSLALFGSSMVTGTAALLNWKRLAKTGLFFMFVSSGFLIAGGAISLGYVGDLDANVNNKDGNTGNVDSERFKELQDFSLAMYWDCCLDGSNTTDIDGNTPVKFVDRDIAYQAWPVLKAKDMDEVRGDFPECEAWIEQNGEPETIEDFLTTCINNLQHVQWFQKAVSGLDGQERWMCDIFENTKVSIAGTELFGFALDQLTDGVLELPIVGDAAPGSLGCGAGKVKAFQFVIYLWFQNVCQPIAYGLLIVGVVSALACMFAVSATCLSSGGSDMDVDMEAVRNYVNRASVRQAALMEIGEIQTAQPVKAQPPAEEVW